MISTLLVILVTLAIVGLVLWALGQIPGIPPIVRTIAYVIVGIILLLWLLGQVQGSHLGLR